MDETVSLHSSNHINSIESDIDSKYGGILEKSIFKQLRQEMLKFFSFINSFSPNFFKIKYGS